MKIRRGTPPHTPWSEDQKRAAHMRLISRAGRARAGRPGGGQIIRLISNRAALRAVAEPAGTAEMRPLPYALIVVIGSALRLLRKSGHF
jgi:hypothetical protein